MIIKAKLSQLLESKFCRQYFSLLSSNILVLLVGMASSIIINRGLSLTERADFALINNATSLLMIGLSFGLGNAIRYKTITLDLNFKVAALAFATVISVTAVVIISALTYFVFWPILFETYRSYFLPFVLTLILQIMFSLFGSYMLADNKYESFGKLNVIDRIVSVVMIVTCYVLFDFNLDSLLWAIITGQLLVTGLSYMRVNFNFRLFHSIKILEKKSILLLGGRNVFVNTIGVIVRRIDIFFVEHYLGKEALAQYSVAMFIFGLISYLPASAGTILANKSASSSAGMYCETRNIAILLALCVFIIACCFVLAGKSVIILLYTSKYIDSFSIFLVFIPLLLADAFFAPFAHVQAGKGYPPMYITAELLCLVISTCLMFILGPKFGIAGIAAGLFAGTITRGIILQKQTAG